MDFIEQARHLQQALGERMCRARLLAAAALVGLAEAEEVLLGDLWNTQISPKGAWTTAPTLTSFCPGESLGVPCNRPQIPSRCASFRPRQRSAAEPLKRHLGSRSVRLASPPAPPAVSILPLQDPAGRSL